MSVGCRFYPHLYKDSVSLMTVSAKLTAVPGIETASVVMASATNVDNLAAAGLGTYDVRPNDLVVAVAGTPEACEEALALVDELLADDAAGSARPAGDAAPQPLTSVAMAVAQDPSRDLALVSVPGDYAAAEALKALRLGLDVMVFSDNVSVADEVELKTYARENDLMVMGPDCGTAIVNGIPLGFANVVRRGPIGVVGASGTGTQEVTVRIHQLGSGVSQALGTGGHDLSDAVGGISMLHGLHALSDDPSTEVIVLVSKPPSAAVAETVLSAAEKVDTPVVVIFLGAEPGAVTRPGVHGARYLAQAADIAVTLSRGGEPAATPITLGNETRRRLGELARSMHAGQEHVRGVFSGGTFCYEAQLVHAGRGISAFSNVPTAGNERLPQLALSEGNTIIDMGDDEFTQGRPHPMIDPSLRDARVAAEAADPSTAVVLFDVVLGYGSSLTPVDGLTGVIATARAAARAQGRTVAFVGYVCGTDADPQDRAGVVAALERAGVMVASSNAEAATWSAEILGSRSGGRS
jgi:succinyl-CoA synthetase alpha subunit